MARPKRSRHEETLAVVLGSGLGSVCAGWPATGEVPFGSIPGIGSDRIAGHEGVLRTCGVEGRTCIFAVGRKHYYEGGDGPVRAIIGHLAGLGVTRLLLTSAAGSLSASFRPGEIAVADGLLDLQFRGLPRSGGPSAPPAPVPPETGGEEDAGGISRASPSDRPPRRGARLLPDPALTGLVRRAGSAAGIPLGRGVMAAMHGPTYETPAEIRALREMGAHFVTMSAAPEIEHAAELGIAAAVLVIITNYATGPSSAPLSHGEVLKAGESAVSQVRSIIRQLIIIK
jgi:purine-nucleoside phosphorylase